MEVVLETPKISSSGIVLVVHIFSLVFVSVELKSSTGFVFEVKCKL